MQKQTSQTLAALREGARGRGFSQRSRLPHPPQSVPPRRTVAAALSAAVTSTKFIGEHSHFQAEPPMQKQTSQTPAALREGARGRGFSQRSRLPRIPRTFLIPSCSSGEGVWGRGASLREAASPPESHLHLFPDMLHALVEHRANVAVGEGVENDFALAAALDQTSLLE